MDDSVNQIKKKIDIVEFIGSFIPLKKAGRNFKANCPFHQEKTPSFIISPDRQIWHCFGACHTGGDVITFFMKWENITFYEALLELARKAGVTLVRGSITDSAWKMRERLIGINSISADFFEYVLHKSAWGKKAKEYLTSRGINEKIAQLFRIGYAPISWDSLLKFLLKKKYDKNEVISTGLAIAGGKEGAYDRFRGRLMFPLLDPRGNIVGFSGRIIDGQDGAAKYVNTPETLLYHKRETLYGIHLAKEAIRKKGKAIIVEGEFDMISPFMKGIENIVAVKGSFVTTEQLALLKRYTNRLTLALDSDPAGIEAVKKSVEEGERQEFEMEAVSFDFAKDPDEAVRKDERRFREVVESAEPVYDFILRVLSQKHGKADAFSKKRLADEMVPYITLISNPIVRSHYVKKLSILVDVPEASIELLIRRRMRKASRFIRETPSPSVREKNRAVLIEKYLISLILQSKDPYEAGKKLFSQFSIEDLQTPSLKKMMKRFIEWNRMGKRFTIPAFAGMLPPELIPVFDEVYLYASGEAEFEKENVGKLVLELKRFILKRKINELMQSESDKDKSDSELKKRMVELKEVEKNLTSL